MMRTIKSYQISYYLNTPNEKLGQQVTFNKNQ